MLLRRLEEDPTLEGVTHVLVDEVQLTYYLLSRYTVGTFLVNTVGGLVNCLWDARARRRGATSEPIHGYLTCKKTLPPRTQP